MAVERAGNHAERGILHYQPPMRADAQRIAEVYSRYGFEIRYREGEMAEAIAAAETMADLRKALEKRTYVSLSLKDKTTIELQAEYFQAGWQIDFSSPSSSPIASAIGSTPEKMLTSSPLYERFGYIQNGNPSSTLTDADLPDLKKFAAILSTSVFLTNIRQLATYYEPKCTPSNIALIALGKNPMLVRAVETTFTEIEKRRVHLD